MKKCLGFVAVWVFLLSCTNTDRDNPNDERASNYIGKSSAEGLSSSEEAGDYPSSSSEENPPSSSSVEPSSSSAEPSSSSEAESSSSVALSSSSVERSSSSAETSSSSEAESSSSVAPSSSSVEPSSSSALLSSSSVAPSSSSVVPQSESSGTFVDIRNNRTYKWVKIGTQTWMAENLNYFATDSKCGDGSNLSSNNTSTCDTYGRLYNWNTAKTVCPSGWHLPSDAEWTILTDYAGGSTSTAGTKLKAASGWSNNGNGTNEYGFSALPGGNGDSGIGGYHFLAGSYGYWWSASEGNSGNSGNAYYRSMGYFNGEVNRDYLSKSRLLSVRCVQ